MRFGFIDHLKGRVGRSRVLFIITRQPTMWVFPSQFPDCPCLSCVPHFPYFSSLSFPNSLPLPPFPPISPAAPVPCPLVPKPSKRVIFLKQRGNNLWRREQKEIFTAGVIKWIFARRMETVLFGKKQNKRLTKACDIRSVNRV